MLRVVRECPRNKESWNLQNDKFGCPMTKMYHCLRNRKGELVEGCFEVTSFRNSEGCPTYGNIEHDKVVATKCPSMADPNGCPESYPGRFLSYETYKSTVRELEGHHDLKTKKIYVSMETDQSDNVGPVIGGLAGLLLLLILVGGVLCVRKRRKRNELKSTNVSQQPMQTIETYDDVRGIGFSPRTRVISVSTDDIARSLEEEEISTARSEITIDEMVSNVEDDDVFMTFHQLQTVRG
ncbi:hypothetical protein FSP39_000434 [Pinctada imbricata]|uniref:Uncharacterized protein n=1 Tax=Pinctada imbricata TaxID=66713 RepID=A0AA89CBB7_PINIB|nr:hypothetical protein FSP39_000434 [Pinctada imbricata]